MSHHFDTLESRQLFAAGSLDKTYGTGGQVLLSYHVGKQTDVTAERVIADSQGRDYVIASVSPSGGSASRWVRRLNADGTVDTTWAAKAGGVLTFNSLYYGSEVHHPEAVDAADRLLVLDGTQLYRYNADGTADATFGKAGVLSLPDGVTGASLTVDGSGRIYVAGTRSTGKGASRTTRATLTRLLAGGKVDASFSDGGTYGSPLTVPSNGQGVLRATGSDVRVFADGSFDLLANSNYGTDQQGFSEQGVESVRFTADGKIAAAYGTRGVASAYVLSTDTYELSANAVGIRADGSVLVATYGEGDEDGATLSTANLLISPNGQKQKSVDYAGGTITAGLIDLANGSTLVYGVRAYGLNADGSKVIFNGPNAYGVTPQPDGTAVTFGEQDIGASDYFHTLLVSRIYLGDAPVATLSAKSVKTAGRSASFTVSYRDSEGIDAATVNGRELRVVAPDGTVLRPRLVGTTTLKNGVVSAVYKVLDADGNPFAKVDDGTYAVRLLADTVQDKAGHAVAKQTAGTFQVAIR